MVVRVPSAAWFAALLVVATFSGCIGDKDPKGDAASGDDTGGSGGGLGGGLGAGGGGGNATVPDKLVSASVKLVDLPLGGGDLSRSYRRSAILPDIPGVLDSRNTLFVLNLTDLWPTRDDLDYQLWLVDEDANESIRSPTFEVTAQGSIHEFDFVVRGEHPTTFNKVLVTLEPADDDVMGMPVLSGTFASGEATSVALGSAGLLRGVTSQGKIEAGKGQLTLAFAATGIPAVADTEYRVWLEMDENMTDLGPMESDENATGEWGFAAAVPLELAGPLILEQAKFAITLEPSGNKDEDPSGAVLLRALTVT